MTGACTLLLESIVPDPTQPRTEFDQVELDQLSESIKRHGILAPLRVRPDQSTGKYCILVGKRFRAARLAGLERVPCVVVSGEISERDILESQIAENLCRVNLNPIERANSFKRYLDLTGVQAKELADLLHVSPATVSKALALLGLDAEVQAKVADGTISATAGQAIAKIKDTAAQQQIARAAETDGLPAKRVEQRVRQKQGPAAPARKPVPTFTVARGCKVIVQCQRTAHRGGNHRDVGVGDGAGADLLRRSAIGRCDRPRSQRP